MKKNFLIEIGTEDLPAKLLKKISKQLLENFTIELKKKNITYKKIYWFSSSRRLAIKIKNINFKKTFKNKMYKGPSLKNSFDEKKKLQKPAIKWLKKFNIQLKDTKIFQKKKKKWLIYPLKKNFNNIKNILIDIIKNALSKLQNFYFMSWNKNKYKFYRPVRNLVIFLNDKLIKTKIFGIYSNKYVIGNFYLKNIKIKIKNANEYPKILQKKGLVIPDFYQRKQQIKKIIQKIIKKKNKNIKYNKNFLNEINSIIEWPNAIVGKFEKKFLSIPKNIIIYILQNIQKIFPLFENNKKISKYFIFIINFKNKPNKQMISEINNVVKSRLQDAKFFFKKDLKNKIIKNLKLLKHKLFFQQLGTMYDKIKRIEKIINFFRKYIKFDKKKLIIAARLSKCDLLSNIVMEYPKLQGITGAYYAKKEGFCKEIYQTIKEQYKPKKNNDSLPKTLMGKILSLSDKLDTLVGVFTIKKKFQENQDPFALRRLSIGILRILIKINFNINFKKIIKKIFFFYNKSKKNKKNINKVQKFITKRFYKIYKKKKNYKKVIKIILKKKEKNIFFTNKKIKSLLFYQKFKNYKKFLLTYKRINNIIKNNLNNIKKKIKFKNLENKKEKKILKKIKEIKKNYKNLKKKQKYKKIIKMFLKINKIIIFYFKNFKINHHDLKIKKNRISTLNILKKIFDSFINFSKFI